MKKTVKLTSEDVAVLLLTVSLSKSEFMQLFNKLSQLGLIWLAEGWPVLSPKGIAFLREREQAAEKMREAEERISDDLMAQLDALNSEFGEKREKVEAAAGRDLDQQRATYEAAFMIEVDEPEGGAERRLSH